MIVNAEREKAGLPQINVPCMLKLRNANGTRKAVLLTAITAIETDIDHYSKYPEYSLDILIKEKPVRLRQYNTKEELEEAYQALTTLVRAAHLGLNVTDDLAKKI